MQHYGKIRYWLFTHLSRGRGLGWRIPSRGWSLSHWWRWLENGHKKLLLSQDKYIYNKYSQLRNNHPLMYALINTLALTLHSVCPLILMVGFTSIVILLNRAFFIKQ